jgi:phage shock protein PspC (stress-responsive transcriptional regulator)
MQEEMSNMYDPQTEPRHLARSTYDRRLGGVAGGLAHYFNVDPTIMRVLWLIAVPVTGGLALLAYFGLWLMLPEGDFGTDGQPAWSYGYGRPGARGLGALLLGIGALVLLAPIAWRVAHFGHVLFPLALVVLGIVLLVRHERGARPTLDL